MGDSGPWGRAVLAVALVWLVVVAPVTADVQSGDAAGPRSQVDETEGTPTPGANESVVRHEDPDRVGSDTSYTDYSDYLASSLANRLGESTIRVSADDYERAQDLLGEEYTEELEQYRDIVEISGSSADEGTAEQFKATADTQRSFVSDVERFNETVEEYRTARQTGNTSRARTLAHRLDRLLDEIDTEGRRLQTNYTSITDETGVDLSTESRTVEEIVETKRAEVEEIEEAEFVPTRLLVENATREISFREPLLARGRVVTVNGTGVPDVTVRVGSPDRWVNVTTDATGRFTVTFRPTVLSLSTRELTLEYFPDDTAPYGGANTTVPVTVSQISPTVSVAPAPDNATFQDTVNISGHVGVSGFGAPGVPVVVTIDRERVGRAETDATGRYRVQTTIPAGLEPGDRRVSASVPIAGRALAPTNATGVLRVNETATELTIGGSQTEDVQQVAFSGRLTTANGMPLAGRVVELVFDGESVAEVTTDDAGRFDGNVTVSRSALPNRPGGVSQPTLEAHFDGNGTNLASSTGEDTVAMEANLAQFVQVNWDRLLAVGAVLAVLLFGRLWYDRRGQAGDGDSTAAMGAGPDGDAGATADGSTLIDRAQRALEAGRPDDAIQLAYLAARGRLVADLGRPSAETPWEFYRRCRDSGMGDIGRLEGLTRLYERAAFDRRSTGRDLAAEAIEAASSLLEGGGDDAVDDDAVAGD